MPCALADALEHLVAGHLAAGERAVGRHRQAVVAAGGKHLALVDERMDLDLVRHQRFARELHRLCEQGVVKFATPTCLARPSRLALHSTPSVSASGTFGFGQWMSSKIDPGQLQLLQAFIERALEVGGRELS